MKKKIGIVLALALVGAMALTGCGSTTTDSSSAEGTANPWTETDKQGVAEATGFDMEAPDGATDVAYSYMAESGLAQMTYKLDDLDWTYRMQQADELTDISGLNYDWGTDELEGKVLEMPAMYYGYATDGDDPDYVHLVNWYDAVPGVTYSLAASGKDMDGMDIQAFAEEIYEPLQGEATDDPEADRVTELNDYFLGEHKRSYDDSTLTIAENSDGTFDVDLSVTRLCSLEDGVGTFDEHKMTFTVKDPSGNDMTGMIYRDSDNSLCVKITESTWELLPTDEVLEGFGK